MLDIARHQLIDGLRNAKYLFIASLILIAFVFNGLVYSENYRHMMEDYQLNEAESGRLIQEVCGNLQQVAFFRQRVLQPPSALSFISEGGRSLLPNVVQLNAFRRYSVEYQHRNNELLTALPALDWSFIVGVLMSLLAILVSYSAVAGEKKNGTLRLVLSNPLSRLKFLIGKYVGLLLVLLSCLLLGIVLNIASGLLSGGQPLDAEAFFPIGWAIALSVLYVSFFLLVGLTVSSTTRNPTTALVILLVIWVLAAFAIPGTGRLIAEQTVRVPSQAEVRKETDEALQSLWENRPRDAANWGGNPFDPHIPDRAKFAMDRHAVRQMYSDSYIESQIRQSTSANTYSAFSPYGLLADAFQILCGSGIHGFRSLYRNSATYRDNLYRFVVNRDMTDSSTPHLVYAWDYFFDPGVFSEKPVPYSAVPRASSLWNKSGLPSEHDWPVLHLILLISFNLFTALIAFFAISYYDPR